MSKLDQKKTDISKAADKPVSLFKMSWPGYIVLVVFFFLMSVLSLLYIKNNISSDPRPESTVPIEPDQENQPAVKNEYFDPQTRSDPRFSSILVQHAEFFLPGNPAKLNSAQINQFNPDMFEYVGNSRDEAKALINARLKRSTLGSQSSFNAWLETGIPQAIVRYQGRQWLRLILTSSPGENHSGSAFIFVYLESNPELINSTSVGSFIETRLQALGFSGETLDSLKELQVAYYGLRQAPPGVTGAMATIQDWTRISSLPYYESNALYVDRSEAISNALTDDEVASLTSATLGFKDYKGMKGWESSMVFFRANNGDILILRQDGELAWLPRSKAELIPAKGGLKSFLEQFKTSTQQKRMLSSETWHAP